MKKNPFAYLWVVSASLVLACGCASNRGGLIEECFGAYSTVKVCQNTDANPYYEKLDPKVSVSMMKNEAEAYQIIFKASQDIQNVQVSTSDLVNDFGDVLPKENITVYFQKYLQLDNNTPDYNENFKEGYFVPDFLLPMDKAIEAHENKMSKGLYQGFVIDIRSDGNTKSGTYKGSLVFDLDGTKKEIPVEATVWDIAYEGTREFKSSFLVYRNWLVGGEYDNSDALVDNYVDMLKDYKVNAMVVDPMSKYLKEGEMESYIDKQVALIDRDPNYSSIPLPVVNIPSSGYSFTSIPNSRFNLSENQQVTCIIYDFIAKLVKHSSNEKNYLKYAYFYLTSFDEMDMYKSGDNSLYQRGIEFFKKGGSLDKLLDAIAKKLRSEGELNKFNASRREEIISSIQNIVRVNPLTSFDETIVETLNQTSCPYISQLENSEHYQRYDYNKEENSNGELWTYSCVGPNNPYPTFHLDDYNLGSRTTGWTLKRRNVTGYLYYAVNIYDEQNGSAGGAFVDPYTSPTRNAFCPGDGFLVYPGKKYHSDKPFPSNRLLAFRDGMDDYDLLSVLERDFDQAKKYYGWDFDFDSMMNDLYDSVINNSLYYFDDSRVIQAREEVAKIIESLSSDDRLLAYSSFKDGRPTTTIYSSLPSLTINGESVSLQKCGSGYSCDVAYSDGDTILQILGETSSLTVRPSFKGLVTSLDSLSGIHLTDGAEATSSAEGLSFRVSSVDQGSVNKNKRFKVGFSVSNPDLSCLRSLDISLRNDGDHPVKMNLSFNGFLSSVVRTIYLYPSQSNTVHFSLFDETGTEDIDGIKIELDNFDLDSNELYSYSRDFTITNLSYTK